mmetsp:Transcript_38421/g.101928  ORF Transcript_38421/g.101928 Transcript_38421/m.101928 type:complete len:674 (+) Transcript_38421:14-2035(+)
MASPGEIQMIVERLREYKIEEDLTLVTFDEKNPQELLQTLNSVFQQLSKDHDVDVRDEDIQTTANRLMEFFPVIQYNFQGESQQFADGIQRGERSVVYPLLVHLLQRLPELKKRAYLSRFLKNIEIPEELFADPEVMDKFQQYKELQEAFKEAHKSTERLRGTSLQPTELKREVAQLEEEKQQLKTKISKLEAKLKKNENFTELYDVTSKLRKEQEEEARLADRLGEQITQLKQADARYFQSKKKLQDVQAASHQGSGEDLLRILEEDVQMTRMLCMEKLPADIQQKQSRLKQIQSILELPSIEESHIQDLQGRIQREEATISELAARQAKLRNPADDKLGMYRQQAAVVARKKQDALERLQNRKDELRELDMELNEKREKSGAAGGVRILKGEDFKEYANKLKEKVREYKRLKAELASVTAEKGVLLRTDEMLRARITDQAAFLAHLEESKGVRGASDLQGKLEEVSAAAATANQAKAVSLDQISATVTKINEAIKEKKNKLAPQIKELRTVRTDFSALEAEYLEKKALYEQAALGLEADRDKLQAEVTAYHDECRREESRFHYLHAMLASTKILLDRAKREDAGKNKIGDAGQGYRELYQSRIQQQENLSKTLREKQKAVKEGYDQALGQARMFKDLRKLLQCKMRLLRAEVDPDAAGGGGGPGSNVMVMD